MMIECCGWRIAAYQMNGRRCWQLFHGGSKTAERYYDNLGDALRFCAEYALRNDIEGTYDVMGAIREYEAICRRIESTGDRIAAIKGA